MIINNKHLESRWKTEAFLCFHGVGQHWVALSVLLNPHKTTTSIDYISPNIIYNIKPSLNCVYIYKCPTIISFLWL